MSPVNPGPRYRMATKTQVAAQIIRTNAVPVAFATGQLAGILLVILVILFVGGR